MSFPWSDLPHDDPAWFRRGALYVPSGTGPTVWAAGDVYTIKARADQTHGGFGLIEATVPAGGGPPPHAHPDEEETFYLLSGELEFLDGDETFLAKAGDFVPTPARSVAMDTVRAASGTASTTSATTPPRCCSSSPPAASSP